MLSALKSDETALSLCATAAAFLGQELSPGEWLVGGDEALVLRADGDGVVFVLHASPARLSRAELAWSHAVAKHAGRTVPEVVTAIGRDGETLSAWRDHHLAVYPFVEGSHVNRDDPAHRLGAARLLAKLHRGLLDWAGGPRPQAAHPLSGVPTPPGLSDEGLDDWWRTVGDGALTTVTHGDYYRRNLICRGQTIVGVIDWHDATIAPLALELAGATFEFCRDAEHELDIGKAQDFANAYREGGGPVQAWEMASLPRFMRLWLRRDVALNLAVGAAADDPYIQRQIEAFQRLARCEWDL